MVTRLLVFTVLALLVSVSVSAPLGVPSWLNDLFGFRKKRVFVEPKFATLAQRYAPKVHLHPEEEYNPCSIDFFLQHTNVKDRRKLGELSKSRDTNNFYISTNDELPCNSCTLDWFKGQNVQKNEAPLYSLVVPQKDLGDNIVDIYYFAYYAYNKGKTLCLGARDPRGVCIGKLQTFGNHLGDFEYTAIRFKDYKPTEMFLSNHYAGTRIPFDDPRLQKQGTHPVLYSAYGSHGFHYTSGRHVYHPTLRLADEFDAGQTWNTWKNLEVYGLKDPKKREYTGEEEAWLNFQGRWGNKSPCMFASKMSLCELENGMSVLISKSRHKCLLTVETNIFFNQST
ncbi:vacuolar protein sorting-associated protein 62 [Paraphysoderma sedebokerense]|nr:vacuolar protein sorting-associated protein 62 [Paraphysoderma sedebokerense]KAI9145355.1 vacuolar protein sorting-associated protein 62 [Paraphysoderma sedebokerense]